jgi:hypothetical protein
MSADYYEPLASEAGVRLEIVKFVGGTNAVTKVFGSGLQVTYVSTGLVDIEWSPNLGAPGSFLGLVGSPGFEATTQSGVAGYTANVGNYDPDSHVIRVAIYNGSNTLANLAAAQWLTLVLAFQTGV